MKKIQPTVVRAADLAAYAPANHTGTSNVRVIGPETVGATALEVLVGTIVESQGAKPVRGTSTYSMLRPRAAPRRSQQP